MPLSAGLRAEAIGAREAATFKEVDATEEAAALREELRQSRNREAHLTARLQGMTESRDTARAELAALAHDKACLCAACRQTAEESGVTPSGGPACPGCAAAMGETIAELESELRNMRLAKERAETEAAALKSERDSAFAREREARKAAEASPGARSALKTATGALASVLEGYALRAEEEASRSTESRRPYYLARAAAFRHAASDAWARGAGGDSTRLAAATAADRAAAEALESLWSGTFAELAAFRKGVAAALAELEKPDRGDIESARDYKADAAAFLRNLTGPDHGAAAAERVTRFTYRLAEAAAPASALLSGSSRVAGDSFAAVVRQALALTGAEVKEDGPGTVDPFFRLFKDGRPVTLSISPAAEQFK